MGTSVYDNWERLVDATLNRENLRLLAYCPSFSSTTCTTDTDTDTTVSTSNGCIFGKSIQLAYSLIRFADDSTSFRTQCLQLKSNAQKLLALLHQAARASNERYERPMRRIVDETVQVLDKALTLVLKCRGNSLMTRVFIITPTAAFSKTLSQLENCIGNVLWLFSISASTENRSDEYFAIPPIAANEPILCLIWEQIAILYTGSVDERAYAAESLGSLARNNDRYGKLIIEEGGVEPLLKLVKEGKLEAREEAARVIGLLGKDPESVNYMIHAGVCLEFAEILKEGPMRVQAVVSKALSEFTAHNPKCQNYLADFGYDKDFDKKYTIGKLLGQCRFGYIYVALDKSNGDRLAVKRIDKSKMVLPIAVKDVKREVKILRALAVHENVVHFYNAFEDDSYVYIVMELCEGGELLDRILSKKDCRYSEKDAAIVVRQMLNVAAECHLHGLVHRDMKPENFLFKSTKKDSPLKVTDFGDSDFIRPGKKFQNIVGSAYYVAPEVLKRKSGCESDVWSIGVITYILLCGRWPFWGKTKDDIFKEVLRNKPDFRRKPWPGISNAAKDFVQKLLVKNPQARLTAAQALSHPWVREGREASEIPLDISVLSNMRQFFKYGQFKQFAHRALASTLDDEEQFDIRDQFDAIDMDKNGVISLEEMRQALEKDLPWQMKAALVVEIFQAIDSNTDGLVDFSEFMAATLHVHQLEEHDSEKWQQRSHAAFENFDVDRDGFITPEELKLHTGLRGSMDPLLEEADIDKDGRISLSEFRRLLKTATWYELMGHS